MPPTVLLVMKSNQLTILVVLSIGYTCDLTSDITAKVFFWLDLSCPFSPVHSVHTPSQHGLFDIAHAVSSTCTPIDPFLNRFVGWLGDARTHLAYWK
jgi:hypothetical protein